MGCVTNAALSNAQFKSLAREAYSAAREHRLAGDLNSADAAIREGAVQRDRATYGTYPNGASKNPAVAGRKTTWRHGDMPSARVLP